jgi:hypothetical protein
MSKIGNARLKLATNVLIQQLSQSHVLYIAAAISETEEKVLKPEKWLYYRKNINTAWKNQKDELLSSSKETGKDACYCEYMLHMSQTYGDVNDDVIEKIIASDEMKKYDKRVDLIIESLRKKISELESQVRLKTSDGSDTTKRLRLSLDLTFADLEDPSDDYLNNIMNNVHIEAIDTNVVKSNKNKKKKKTKKHPTIINTFGYKRIDIIMRPILSIRS